VLGGIFNSGILASGTRSGGTIYYDYAPASERILEKVRALEQVCARFNVPLAAAALQFALAGPSVAAVVPGARSPQEVGRALHYRSAPIPQEFWSELIARGLIDAAAPVPPSTIRGNP
jgi:D-threo-aldose 1-dehydrogenase